MLAATGVGLGLFYVLSVIEERVASRSVLRRLDDYELDDSRAKVLLNPLHQRLFGGALEGLGDVADRFNPPEYVERIRKRHLQAGINDQDRVEKFLAVRVLSLAIAPIWFFTMLVLNPLGLGGLMRIAIAVCGAVVFGFAPNAWLSNRVGARQQEIRRNLPDVLDLLVISVESGLGFEQAIDRVVANVPGELTDEFSRVLGETQAGSSRSDALRRMQERIDTPEIRSFVLAMIQADNYGVSIARVLRAQTDELRIKRRQLAQELAQKAPVKMMIPMVFCVFPALFVVVIGPAIINISQNL